MHVLMISDGIPTPQYPLPGIFGFDQAKALKKQGVNVTYFGIDLRSIRRTRTWGIVSGKEDGVEWHVINYPVGRVPSPLFIRIGKRGLQKLYSRFINQSNRPDIVHAHFTEIGAIAASLAKKEKIPFILTEHSSAMNMEFISPKTLKLAQKTYGSTNKLLTVSNSLKNNIKKHIGVESTVIPDVVNGDVFFSIKKKEHAGFGFVCTGRLIFHKRPDLLVRAFAKVHEVFPDSFLGYIGDGNYKTQTMRLVRELGLENAVNYYGLKTRREIAEIYEKYDCFVMPSSKETFGVVYIEAMASGLPVIATKCGGPEDFINKENGILVDPDCVDQLATAMCHVYKNRKEYDSVRIRQYVNENFSGHAIAKRLIKEYKTVDKRK